MRNTTGRGRKYRELPSPPFVGLCFVAAVWWENGVRTYAQLFQEQMIAKVFYNYLRGRLLSR